MDSVEMHSNINALYALGLFWIGVTTHCKYCCAGMPQGFVTLRQEMVLNRMSFTSSGEVVETLNP